MFAIRRTTLILLVTLVAGTASVSLNTAIAPSSPTPGHLVVQNDRDLAGGCSQGLTVSYKPKTVDTAFAVKFTTDASNCTVSVLYHTLVTALDPIGPAAVQGAMERNRASIVTAYLNTAVWTFPPTQVCPRTEYSDEEGVNVPNTLDHHFHEVRTEREFPPYCESSGTRCGGLTRKTGRWMTSWTCTLTRTESPIATSTPYDGAEIPLSTVRSCAPFKSSRSTLRSSWT